MDGSLTIRCQNSGQKGHKCDDNCGSLYAEGSRSLFHAGAIVQGEVLIVLLKQDFQILPLKEGILKLWVGYIPQD